MNIIMRSKLRYSLLTGSAALLLSGCVTMGGGVTKDSYINFASTPLNDAEIMPSAAELRSERIKAIVIQAGDGDDPLARQGKVGLGLTRAVSEALSEGGVEIVDNSVDPKLAEALRIAEAKGTSTYTGPKLANYAIKPSINLVNYQAAFSQGMIVPGKRGQQATNIPASYTHTGDVKATLQIYTLPNLHLVESINITGKSVIAGDSRPQSNTIGAGLVTKAAAEAVDLNKADLLNVFTGKGYVSARKSFEKLNIFLITLGKKHGLKPGDKVEIYNLRPMEGGTLGNQNDGPEEVKVANCVVTEILMDGQAWVVADSEESAKRVLRGDIAKLVKTDSTGASIMKTLNKFR